MTQVEFHPAAVREAAEAYRWYAQRSERAAERFLAELDRAVLEVSSTPERFSEHLLGTRRFLFRRFPYLLVYRVLAEQVQVIAVAHGRRNPRYWKRRSE